MTGLVRISGNAVTQVHLKSVHVDGEGKHKGAPCPFFKSCLPRKRLNTLQCKNRLIVCQLRGMVHLIVIT